MPKKADQARAGKTSQLAPWPEAARAGFLSTNFVCACSAGESGREEERLCSVLLPSRLDEGFKRVMTSTSKGNIGKRPEKRRDKMARAFNAGVWGGGGVYGIMDRVKLASFHLIFKANNIMKGFIF